MRPVKLENCFTVKETSGQTQRQPTEWKKKLNHMNNTGLISNMHK